VPVVLHCIPDTNKINYTTVNVTGRVLALRQTVWGISWLVLLSYLCNDSNLCLSLSNNCRWC